ncbi:MAG: NAD(P)H-quinone oxidoreductase [Archangium sp.]|nr:NAD(P)H-quinone oxidoreductase [Archangium sp.]
MHVIRIATFTGPEGLRVDQAEAPTPGPEEIAVTVYASALNRADLVQSQGRYPAPPGVAADIPGLEYAGVVAAVGARVRRWKVGDRVMGLVGGGAWAEVVVTHELEALPIPARWSFHQAAAAPEAFSTAYDALVRQAGVTVGSRVLIHAAASGVGTAAAQICRVFGGRAIGTGRSEAKLARVQPLGFDAIIHTGAGPVFAERVRELTGGRGVDVVLDLIGGDSVTESVEAMAPGGILVLVGLVAGSSATLPLGKVLMKRLQLRGTTLRSRPLDEKIQLARNVEKQLLPSFESGALMPIIDEVVPMHDVATALERLSRNETVGKVVLAWSP